MLQEQAAVVPDPRFGLGGTLSPATSLLISDLKQTLSFGLSYNSNADLEDTLSHEQEKQALRPMKVVGFKVLGQSGPVKLIQRDDSEHSSIDVDIE